ncbi:hypothetical protein MKK75_32205 [Methylobacterium sp. J-030]|uniref:hypothetical protein n=1 Tax=Methylobacterium sp. J-030 TaxID=2836627 RepID=UPI001FBAA607|nr:hypothetical protein [Methylobacterium sp. J-030]MCJ2073395.1 hypothetical protein [Methylobacterium sp. J-030]
MDWELPAESLLVAVEDGPLDPVEASVDWSCSRDDNMSLDRLDVGETLVEEVALVEPEFDVVDDV